MHGLLVDIKYAKSMTCSSQLNLLLEKEKKIILVCSVILSRHLFAAEKVIVSPIIFFIQSNFLVLYVKDLKNSNLLAAIKYRYFIIKMSLVGYS